MKKRGFNFKLSLHSNFNSKATVFTLGFTYLYLIAEIVYKVKVERTPCTWEIILLFLIFSVYGIFRKLFSKEDLPLDHSGSPLPYGSSKKDKKKRNSFYKKSALIYSAIFAVVSTVAFSCSSLLSNVNVSSQLFSDTPLPNFILAVIMSVIFMPIVYIFAYMIEFLWYEYKITMYREMMEEKEEEEARHRAILQKLLEEEKKKEEASAPAPKKRGRPRKVVSEETEKPANPPRRRGRPSKNTETNE